MHAAEQLRAGAEEVALLCAEGCLVAKVVVTANQFAVQAVLWFVLYRFEHKGIEVAEPAL